MKNKYITEKQKGIVCIFSFVLTFILFASIGKVSNCFESQAAQEISGMVTLLLSFVFASIGTVNLAELVSE